ncbi:peptidase [Salmonella enterica subsp. enterica serovar Bovismorbificans]|nr:peptidase [Salmonella enterica subsp. enterica serovar Bovismorbificans]
MGNALFRKLFHSALMNEAPAPEAGGGGGDNPVPTGDVPASAADQEKPEGDKPQPGTEGDKPPEEKSADGDKSKEDKPAEDKEQKQEGAPEKYEFQAAEGVELDAEALKDFEPVARELNLTNEQAQKLVDTYPKILEGVQHRQMEAWQKTTEQWAADVKADKEIGGDKLTSNLSAAQRALDQFGTPELKEYLNTTGLGNHPDLVKTFVKIGKAMSEDGMVDGSNQGQRSAAEVLYG